MTTLRTSSRKPSVIKQIPIQTHRLFGETPKKTHLKVCDNDSGKKYKKNKGEIKLPKNYECLNLNPNIYMIHNFLTKTEIQHLMNVSS